MAKPRLLIAGAGYLGLALARQLLANSRYQPLLLRRSPSPMPGFAHIQADLLAPDTLQQLPKVDAVVYCAAADEYSEVAYQNTYQLGLKHLMQALRKNGSVRRWIYISSTSVYTEQNGGWVDETTLELATKGPSSFMVKAEQDLQTSEEDFVILRLGGIYGPERTAFLKRIYQGIEPVCKSQVYSNRIHRDDAVGMILHALDKVPGRQIFNAVDAEAAERNEVIQWLAKALGLNADHFPQIDDIALIPQRGNKRVRNDKILSTAYKLVFPSYREGFQSLLAANKTPQGSFTF